MNARPAIALMALTLALGGCASTAPRTPPLARLQPSGPAPWTQDFGDPVLADLLHKADQGALDIKSALARLERAQAEVRAAQAARALTVTLGADAAVGGRNRRNIRSAATPSLAAAYEADLFGRLASGADAAKAERRASEADLRAARLLVGAETARAYVALRAAQAAEAEAAHRQADAGRALSLVGLRAREGRAGADELSSRQQALAEAEAEIDAARLEAQQQAIRLAALTGDEIALPPQALPHPAAVRDIPSDIAARRPDVIAAYERLRAADAQRAVAVAATRPTFVLGLSLGSVDPGVLNLLDARSLAWAAAASLSHEILDGGRNSARVSIASSDADIADIAYRKALVQGWGEIRAALAETAAADAGLARATAAAGRARSALAAGGARHREGVIDGVSLADLQGQAAVADAAVAQAQARTLSARIAVALAAGG